MVYTESFSKHIANRRQRARILTSKGEYEASFKSQIQAKFLCVIDSDINIPRTSSPRESKRSNTTEKGNDLVI